MFIFVRKALIILAGLFVAIIVGAVLFYAWWTTGSESNTYIGRWFANPSARAELASEGGIACDGAPFILPSSGFVGLLYKDPARPYNPLRPHPGVDIFGDGQPGTVPIYAAYDGYLSRLPGWIGTVIIQHQDPLQPGRKIWTYYTHMANTSGSQDYIVDDFPTGTYGQPVKQGDLLGYQGTYSGNGTPIGMHLHFSIVQAEWDGSFKNEAIFGNTLDPTPYLNMNVNIDNAEERPVRCQS